MENNEEINNEKSKDQITALCSALGINEATLAKKLKYKSPASVYNVQKKSNRITKEMANRILVTFPEVNPDFLYNNEGEVLRLKEISQVYKEHNPDFDKKPLETIADIFAIPERLRVIEEVLVLIKLENKEILEILKEMKSPSK